MKTYSFVKVHTCVITDERLDVYEKMTYVALCKFADSDGKCFPRLKLLSAIVGCSRTRLRQSLKKLAELKYITITARKHNDKQRSNIYTLCPREDLTGVTTRPDAGHQMTQPGSPDGPITISNITRSKEEEPGELKGCAKNTPALEGQFSYIPDLIPEVKKQPPSSFSFKTYKKPEKTKTPEAAKANTKTFETARKGVLKDPPYDEILDSFKRYFPNLKEPFLDNSSRMWIRLLCLARNELYLLEGWERYFKAIKDSPFLMGDNAAGWVFDFRWLLNPHNMDRVKNGFFKKGGLVYDIFDSKVKADDLPEETRIYVLGLLGAMKKRKEAA